MIEAYDLHMPNCFRETKREEYKPKSCQHKLIPHRHNKNFVNFAEAGSEEDSEGLLAADRTVAREAGFRILAHSLRYSDNLVFLSGRKYLELEDLLLQKLRLSDMPETAEPIPCWKNSH